MAHTSQETTKYMAEGHNYVSRYLAIHRIHLFMGARDVIRLKKAEEEEFYIRRIGTCLTMTAYALHYIDTPHYS